MAIKNLIKRGFGYNPGSVKFIPLHGFSQKEFKRIVFDIRDAIFNRSDNRDTGFNKNEPRIATFNKTDKRDGDF